MSDPAPTPAPEADDQERLLGPLRLAFFTPVREYPPLADRKAVILLAALSLMVSVLLAFSTNLTALLKGPNLALSLLTGLTLKAQGLQVLFGAWFAFESLMIPVPPMPATLAYFPHIAALGPEDYRRQVRALDYRQALAAILHYNYSYATLSVAKFRLIDRSFRCVRATFETWVVLLVLITFVGK